MKTLKLISVSGLVIFLGTALWAIPPGFNIQGRLTDASGVNKDGAFQIKFSIFAVAEGGVAVWEKAMPTVMVKNGNFQVILQGEGDIGGQLEDAVKNLITAYVEIKVGTEPPLVPRQPLLRSPFGPPTVNLVGAVMFFAGAICPSGWTLLDGSILPVTGNEALFDHVKYLYGGSGSNFVLPNMIDGRFIRSIGGNAAGLGAQQLDAFKSHTHTIPRRTGMGYSSVTSALGNSIWTPIESSPAGDAETRPLNYAMTPCIKN